MRACDGDAPVQVVRSQGESQTAARRQQRAENVQSGTIPKKLVEALSMPTLVDEDDGDDGEPTTVKTPNSGAPPMSQENESQSGTTASLLASAASSLCKTNCMSSADPPASPKATKHDPRRIIESLSPQPNKQPLAYNIESTSKGQASSPEEPTLTRGTSVKHYFTSTSKSWSQLFGSTGSGGNVGTEASDGIDNQGTATISKLSRVELLREKQRQHYELDLEGVIQLDEAPILQCQEIYNKIIGNHQTSIVTKQDVITLLQLDRKEHEAEITETGLQEGKGGELYSQHVAVDNNGGNQRHVVDDNDDNDSLVAAAVKEEQDFVANFSASTGTAAQRISGWARKLGFSQSFSSNDSAESELQQLKPGLREEVEANASLDNITPGASSSSDPTSWYSKQDQSKEIPPLVGYWAWKNTIRTHKIQMHLAKNSDLALHGTLLLFC